MENFIPPTTLTLLFVAFSALRFECQRWLRLIVRGQRGSSDVVITFVNVTALLSLLVGLCVLALVFWNWGWQVGLGLFVISFFAGLIASLVVGVLFGGDSFVIQLLATIGLWPVGYFLVQETLSPLL